ncbi:hypothetical protein JAAARDRAFT_399868 [Jaapia argillacea MUCL 33604]|uniref:Uncharacterized protein n=1 Tax=Jaapia argillacea MUCL 33604 TaxID=933084 RepID=A0A067PTK7_9AGAM|nr:hypothetical protein JAAARDRAFT_399868 [Jaapia argillacea MUCL 33604]
MSNLRSHARNNRVVGARLLPGTTVIAVVFLLAKIVTAQSTNAVCLTPSLLPAGLYDNSLQQTPCKVAAVVWSPCVGSNNINNISVGESYASPTPNGCACSSVFYSLVSACALCQNGTTTTWSAWVKNCTITETTVAGYPYALPSGIAVPHWAYIDPTITDNFDVAAASTMGGTSSTDRTRLYVI